MLIPKSLQLIHIQPKNAQKKGLPIKSDEESYVVDKVIEISNLDLVKDLNEVITFVSNTANLKL